MSARSLARPFVLAPLVVAALASIGHSQTTCFTSPRQVHLGDVIQHEGHGPTTMIAADLDGDGRTDLIAPCTPNRIEIVWNGPNELAHTTQVVLVPVLPIDVAAADADADGDLDLMVIAQPSLHPSVVLVRNLGGRQFGAPEVAIDPNGTFAKFADMNGDGAADVVTGNLGEPWLRVRWNSGSGTFPTETFVPSPTGTLGHALGDWNGDGLVDVVVAPYAAALDGSPTSIHVLLNLGGGTFAPPQSYVAGVRPWLARGGDVDRDGDLDVIVLDRNGNSTTGGDLGFVRVFRNDGAANLTETAVVPVDPVPLSIAIGDVDGDGIDDLAVTCEFGDRVQIARGTGAGAFAPPISFPVAADSSGVAILDADHDGRLDVAVAGQYDATIDFLHNEGANGLRAGEGSPATATPTFVTFTDVSGDGVDDRITLDREARLFAVQITTPGGPGAMVTHPLAPMPNSERPSDVAFADVDLDGDRDAIVVEDKSLALFTNTGGGAFALAARFGTIGHATAVAVGDFDQDGDPDLAYNQELPHKTGLFLNAGGGVFVPGTDVYVGGNMGSLCAGDFDGDGWTDLALLRDTTSFWIARNVGAGLFVLGPAVTTVAAPRRAHAVDVDSDGDLDLIMASAWWDGVGVARNLGGGAFGPTVALEPGAFQFDLAVVDVNGDGHLDLVFPYLNRLDVWTGDGAGGFARDRFVATGTTVQSLCVRDVDHDGALDVAWVDGRTPEVRVLRGCATSARAICAGDGSATACPCGNASPSGAGAGCLHSGAIGGVLRAVGAPSLWNEEVVLVGRDMPLGSPVLYLASHAVLNGGAGVVFGDGVRCVGSPVTRLGMRTNLAGASSFPGPGEGKLSARSGVFAPGVHYYQAWYRDAASYCSPASFDLTNAIALLWSP